MLHQVRSTSRVLTGRGRGAAARVATRRGMAGASRRPAPPPFGDRLREFEREWEEFTAKPQPAGLGAGTVQFEGEDRAVELGVTRPIDLLDTTDAARDPSLPPVVAVLDGDELWDLTRPLERSCGVQVVSVDDPRGQATFWHSAAHILGLALEAEFGEEALLCDGPALAENGFFYELCLRSGGHVSEEAFKPLRKAMQRVVKRKEPFLRLPLSREAAARMFHDNPFKLDMLRAIPEGEQVTVYRCGPFVDLCRGPHVPHTGLFGGMDLLACGASHWTPPSGSALHAGKGVALDDEGRALLQRVYAVAFPTSAQLKDWRALREEAQRRDHRTIGRTQKLWHFSTYAPGAPIMLPHGARVFNGLVSWLRGEYWKRGYEEILTPQLYRPDLWRVSGHLQNYAEHMYMAEPGVHLGPAQENSGDGAEAEGEGSDVFGIKPMNCPAHCLVFDALRPTARELPMRVADFSPLHRNELAGALTGLTRVRRFHQDDAHIFCTEDQVEAEIDGVLDFVEHVYQTLGFEYSMKLSTRPEKYMGDLSKWNRAEDALRSALDSRNISWELNPGDGAFYGPKIDVSVRDALRRHHQCATVQLDFQLPDRFDLSYTAPGGESKRPVMIHRAVLGSVERMLAIFTEHVGGRWPLWLSPRQVQVVPVSESQAEYAAQVGAQLRSAGLYADWDTTSRSMQKKIREAQLLQYNYICVVGDEEVTAGCVNVRRRDGTTVGLSTPEAFAAELGDHIAQRRGDV